MSSAEVAFAAAAPASARTLAVARAPAPQECNVAVIGAGPYGLAAAAHLMAAGIETLAFGDAMAFWRNNMPKGMRLRSPWRATHIADPRNELSLDVYAGRVGLDPAAPLPIADFVGYGAWFQGRAVPDLDRRRVSLVEPAGGRFRLTLDDGSVVGARRVVVAMGLANQSFRPTQLAGLPPDLASHSSEHSDFAAFRGRRVAVIGRGQSACESAVLLSEAGADVVLISRGEVHWIGAETPSKDLVWNLRRALTAKSEVGPFPLDWLADAPGLFHRFPGDLRARLGKSLLRAAG